MRLLHFTISFGVIAILALIIVNTPKRLKLSISDRYVGVYNGLGITDDNSVLGYRFLEFQIDDSPYSKIVVTNQKRRYNSFSIYYPSGGLMVKGTCGFEGQGANMYPMLDDVCDATCYLPDGSVGTEVKNGTGTLTTYHASGEPHWIATYDRFNRVKIDRFDPGQIQKPKVSEE